MRTLLTNAVVIDGIGGVHDRYEVVVEDARIVAVRPVASAAAGFDTVYDLSGCALLPGLIDTHVHIGGGDYDPSFRDESSAMVALRSLEAAQRSLLAGFTTIRSSGAQGDVDVDIRDAISQGLAWGPRILASGRGITHTGGHMHSTAIEADGVDAVRAAVRRLVRRGVDNIKLFGVSAGVATAGADIHAAGFSIEEIHAGVTEAVKFGKLVQVHAISLAGIKNALAAGVPSIDHGHVLDEEVCERMRRMGVSLVPTFGPGYCFTVRREAEPWRIERAEEVRKLKLASFGLVLTAGIPVAMGSDLGGASRMKSGENALELTLMVEAGMTAEAAILSATGTAARLLGLTTSVGSIELGKLADLLAVTGNPLDDIRLLETSARLVMRSGRVYKDETRC